MKGLFNRNMARGLRNNMINDGFVFPTNPARTCIQLRDCLEKRQSKGETEIIEMGSVFHFVYVIIALAAIAYPPIDALLTKNSPSGAAFCLWVSNLFLFFYFGLTCTVGLSRDLFTRPGELLWFKFVNIRVKRFGFPTCRITRTSVCIYGGSINWSEISSA